MTSIPSPRALPAPSRAAPAPAPGAGQAIDPVKLVNKYKIVLLAAMVVGVVVGVAGHVGLLLFYPTFSAKAVLQFYPPPDDITRTLGVDKFATDELETHINTQKSIIGSELILNDVANNPKLLSEAPTWCKGQKGPSGSFDPSTAALELEDTLNIRMVPGTQLLEIGFNYRKKQDVAGVVKVVTDTYMNFAKTEARRGSSGRRDGLARQVTDLTNRINTLQRERDRMLQEEAIDTLDNRISQKGEAVKLVNSTLVEVTQYKEATLAALSELETQLSSPGGIQYDDTIREQVEVDPLVMNLKQTVVTLESQLAALRAQGVTPKHRNFIALQTQIDGFRQQLGEMRETRMREAFDAKVAGNRTYLAQLNAQEAEMLKQLEELSVQLVELTRIQATVTDMNQNIEAMSEQRASREEEMAAIDANSQLPTASRVEVFQQPQVPQQVTFPKWYIMVPAGVVMVVGLVGGFVLLKESLDQRVKGPADVRLIPRMSVVGMLPHTSEDPTGPKSPETAFLDDPRGVFAESIRQMRTPLVKALQQNAQKTVVFVPGMPQSGATTVVLNLAAACATAGQRVLVIDANYRRPRLHDALGAPESPGLADVLGGQTTLDAAIRAERDGKPALLPAGTPARRVFEHLDSPAMSRLLAEAAAQYDLVLIDSSPAIVSGDGVALANRADAAVLVVRAYAEKRGLVARVGNDLANARGEFMGVLVNAVRSAAGGYLRRNFLATHAYVHEATPSEDKPAAKAWGFRKKKTEEAADAKPDA